MTPERPEKAGLAAAMAEGRAHRRGGRPGKAEAAFRRVLAAEPDHAHALHQLGLVALEARRHAAAAELIGKAIAAAPGRAMFHVALGRVLAAWRKPGAAVAAFQRAIDLRPGLAPAHLGLGNALRSQGKPDEAAAACRRAVELKPANPHGYLELGNALNALDRRDEASAMFRRAIEIKPDFHLARYNLGNALLAQDRFDEAVATYRRTVEFAPRYAPAHCNMGAALQKQGRLDQAEAAYRRAIEIRPNYADGHVNLGILRLLQGDFGEGFEEYEWRWKAPGWPTPPRSYPQPVWDGVEPLTGKTVLLHTEQGLGDTLQFIRYASLVRGLCGSLVVECQKPLVRLLRGLDGVADVVARGDPLPAFDLYAPLLSLPRLFNTTLETIPDTVPYLTAEPGAIDGWRDRLAGDGRLTVGLIWASNPKNPLSRGKSVPPALLRPFLEVPGTRVFAVQFDAPANHLDELGLPDRADDLGSEIADFADTAAIVAALDLLITVDTAAAHLAGALGRPVWTLLPFRPDWRWLLDRDDSPWYPTMRLFRQQQAAQWDPVIERLRGELTRVAGGDREGLTPPG